MNVLDEGHRYQLNPLKKDGNTWILQFHKYKMETKNEGDDLQGVNVPVLETVYEGTTNEEVLRALIDRLYYLQEQFPCKENLIAVTKLNECLTALNLRTIDRMERGVHGKREE